MLELGIMKTSRYFKLSICTLSIGVLLVVPLGSAVGVHEAFATIPPGPGYYTVGADGGVFSYNEPFLGSAAGSASAPFVGIGFNTTGATEGEDYLLTTVDGQVYACSQTCTFYQSLTGGDDDHIVGIATIGNGYWLADSAGNVFSSDDAVFHGSLAGYHLNSPIVGIAPTADDNGYWLVAADGGVFSFGSAKFYGSLGSDHLNAPIVGITADPAGGGYWLVASDGGVFSFGAAAFHGSTGGLKLNSPVVGMQADSSGGGYWLAAADGGIVSVGDAPFEGSQGQNPPSRPIVGIAVP
jgi:hypothetical protein